jgi:hypothetical protein
MGSARQTGLGYAATAAKKTLDVMQGQGQQLVQLIDQAAGLGRNIDVKA